MKIETWFNVLWHARDADGDAETGAQGDGDTERAAINGLVERLLEQEYDRGRAHEAQEAADEPGAYDRGYRDGRIDGEAIAQNGDVQ